MKKKDRLRLRRRFLTDISRGGLVLLGGSLLMSSCGQKGASQAEQQEAFQGDPCEDLRAVSEAELSKRQNLGYLPESPIPDNVCSNCNLYLPTAQGRPCGGCILFEGPVQAQGYCTYWAPKG